MVNDNGTIITTDYAGNYVYENNALQFFNQPEGYVEISSPPSGELEGAYVYQYKDHLGNIRLSYADADGNGAIAQTEIREENNYYPFGLKHKGYNANINGTHHKYMFGGKEQQDELGLDWYDITARNYDPALGRWMNIDPLAEQMRRHSPYNYAFDNPIFFIDYDGMAPMAWPPTKKILSQTGSTTKPFIVNRFKNGIPFSRGDTKRLETKGYYSIGGNISTQILPTSNQSYTSSSSETSALVELGDEFAKTLGLVSQTFSVSQTNTTVSGQFFDSDGNKVDNIDSANSFTATTTSTTSTVKIDGGVKINDNIEVSTLSSTSTFNVNGKELTNENTTNTSSLTTINFDKSDNTKLKAAALSEVKSNAVNRQIGQVNIKVKAIQQQVDNAKIMRNQDMRNQ